jgi:hypothetical protein
MLGRGAIPRRRFVSCWHEWCPSGRRRSVNTNCALKEPTALILGLMSKLRIIVNWLLAVGWDGRQEDFWTTLPHTMSSLDQCLAACF